MIRLLQKHKNIPDMNCRKILFAAVIIICLAPWRLLYGGEVVFIATSDLHGEIERFALLAPVIRRYPEAVKVDVGDFVQGKYAVAMQNGMPVIRAFNELGYSFIVPGNHDLEFPETVLCDWQKEFHGEFLCGQWSLGKFKMPAFATVERNGLRIGIVALGDMGLKRRRGIWQEFRYTDANTVVRDSIRILKAQNCHAILLLCHAAIDNYATTGQILRDNPEISAVIGGHSHRESPGSMVSGRLSAQPGAHGKSAVCMTMVFDDDKKLRYVHSKLLYPQSVADQKLKKIADSCLEQENSAGKTGLGKFRDPDEFGKYCAGILQDVTGAQAAIFRFDSQFFQEEITPLSLFRMIPYGNRIAVVTLDHKEAELLFKHSSRGNIKYSRSGEFPDGVFTLALSDYMFFREQQWQKFPVKITDIFIFQEIVSALKTKEYPEKGL